MYLYPVLVLSWPLWVRLRMIKAHAHPDMLIASENRSKIDLDGFFTMVKGRWDGNSHKDHEWRTC